MKKTPNFSLSQWEFSDRIRMEDFNNDNLQMDNTLQELTESIAAETAARKSAVSAEASARTAAVQAETAARNSAIAALEQRSTLQVVKSITLTEGTTSYSLSFAGIDWSKWREVILTIDLIHQGNYKIIPMGQSQLGLTSEPSTIIMYPMYRGDHSCMGIWLGQTYPAFRLSASFQDTVLYISSSEGKVFAPGSKFTMYGMA